MSEVTQAIGRVRRAMPRNADVMLICDELDKLLRTAFIEKVGQEAYAKTLFGQAKPKLSRAEIQRNYRLRKAKEAAKKDKRK